MFCECLRSNGLIRAEIDDLYEVGIAVVVSNG